MATDKEIEAAKAAIESEFDRWRAFGWTNSAIEEICRAVLAAAEQARDATTSEWDRLVLACGGEPTPEQCKNSLQRLPVEQGK